jgi:predicted anti-sigma-YlaC factor YlaD
MECEEVSNRLWEYLDKELDPKEAKSIGEHVLGCPWCRSAYCCGRAFLNLLARQRQACMAPDALVLRMRRLLQH